MKTLDEVIDDFEKAYDLERRCENCSGCLGQENGCPNDGTESIPDALSYLKKYRDNKKYLRYWTEKAISEQQNIIDGYMIQKNEDNPVLTWEQLKTMEGKPVWVEQCNGDTKGWILILRTNYDVINCTTKHDNSFYLYKSSYGEKWQAYRKERE